MTMLEVKGLSSPDVEIDSWEPSSREDVFFVLQVEIGVVLDERSDLFELVVATPEALRSRAKGDVIVDRGTLVVSDFSWKIVREALKTLLERSAGRDWNESVLRLQRYFRWEYEDYIESHAN